VPPPSHNSSSSSDANASDLADAKQPSRESQVSVAAMQNAGPRLKQIVDTAFEGIWQVDPAGKTVFANERMAQMLGYTHSEFQTLSVFDVSEKSDAGRLQEKLASRARGIREQHDWRFRHKDGGEVWGIVSAVPLLDEHGKHEGTLALITDITERKHTQERLERISRLYSVSSHISAVIVRSKEPLELYRQACRVAVEQGRVKFAWIGTRGTNGQLEIVAHCGGSDEYIHRVLERVRGDSSVAGAGRRTYRNGVISVVNDIENDSTFALRREARELGFRACATFPLKHNGDTFGLMAIYGDQVGYFNDEELHVLTALSENIAFAVTSAQTERALTDRERMLTTLFSNLPGMTYRCRNDDNWTLELVSPGCLELTGYVQECLLGNRDISYEQLIHPLDREAVRMQVEAGLATKQAYEMTYRIVTANNELKWVWERGTGVFDEHGELRFLEGFITDVTARRRAEEKVASQAALLDKANDAIVLYGMDDVVSYWNRGAERLYGWTAAEAIGNKITSLICRDTPTRRTLTAKLVEHGEWSGELTHFAKNGAEVIVEASWTLVRTDVGEGSAILSINTDVTQRKKLEAQFLTAQRLESIGTLAGGIAHDFNNILMAISGNAKLALEEFPENHPLHATLTEINKASARATSLVRQILTFSRQQEPQRQLVDLRAIVSEALRLLRATLPAQIVIVDKMDAAPQIAADITQIHQVIVNLGTNAAYAMRERGGTFTVQLDVVNFDAGDTRVPASLRPGSYARIAVSDTGEGIDASILQRIFEPFFTTKALGQGTGLGLSVVHGIVARHDGAIVVSSEQRRGTTFHVYFPVVDAPIRTAAPPKESTKINGRGKRVLYIDDEEPLVFLMTRVLERMGYRLTGHTEAAQALRDFRATPQEFDAVVSDLSMPSMTGIELARELLAIRPDLPIVLTSGYLRDEDMQEARKLNIRELVLKPNTVEDLGSTLHRILGS